VGVVTLVCAVVAFAVIRSSPAPSAPAAAPTSSTAPAPTSEEISADRLAGIYFQAVERQTFDVEFVRLS